MAPTAPSTLSSLLEHEAVTRPGRQAISALGGQKLTAAHLKHLEVAAASRILSSGVLPGDHVALVFGNTEESVIMILGAIRCRAVAVPMHPAAYTQEEFEIFFSQYEIKLLLTGPPSNDGETPAQAAAAMLRIPHAIASVGFLSGHVDISSFLLPSSPSAGAGASARGLAEVVNNPWDVALLLPRARGAAGSPACGAVMLTQGQLASVEMGQVDVLNVISELESCLANVKLVENHYFLANLSSMILASCAASRTSVAARVTVQNPTTIGGLVIGGVPHGLLAATGEPAGVVARIARAEEHDLKMKDMLMLSGAAAVAVLASVLSRQLPQAAAEKASVPFLLFFLALNFSYLGQILETRLGRLQEFFKMGSQFLYISGTAGLAVSLLPPAYGYTALAVTMAVGLGAFTLLLLNLLGMAPPPPTAAGTLRGFVSQDGQRVAKGPKGVQPAAGLDV